MEKVISEGRITLDNMLHAPKDATRQGRPQPIPEGSTTLKLLEEMALTDKEHWDVPFPDLAKTLGIGGVRSTTERVRHNRHAVFRRKPKEKPPLNRCELVLRFYWQNSFNGPG